MAEQADKAQKHVKRSGGSKIHNATEFGSYVHAVTIPMRVMMAAIVVFFAGAVAYCVFGTVPIELTCGALSNDGCTCYVKSDDRNGIEVGDAVRIKDVDYSVASVSAGTTTVDESIDYYVRQVGGLELGDEVFLVTVEGDVPKGAYEATIVKDYLNPVQVLLQG